MFVIAYNVGQKLTLASIYSVLEIMSSLKMASKYMILGFGTYYELKIVCGRFASILNIQNKSMIKINSDINYSTETKVQLS